MQAIILEVVDNQLREQNPPETRQTYERLLGAGYSDEEARKLIGAVVASETFEVMKQQQAYNKERFIKALAKLPKMPWGVTNWSLANFQFTGKK